MNKPPESVEFLERLLDLPPDEAIDLLTNEGENVLERARAYRAERDELSLEVKKLRERVQYLVDFLWDIEIPGGWELADLREEQMPITDKGAGFQFPDGTIWWKT